MILVAVQAQPIWQVSTTDKHTCNDLADEFARKSTNKAAQAASSRYESGKPVIITDFSVLATRQALALARKTEMRWMKVGGFTSPDSKKKTKSWMTVVPTVLIRLAPKTTRCSGL